MRHENPSHSLIQVMRQLRLRIYPPSEQDSGSRLATQLAVEGLLAAVVLNLATVYTSMFASRMGANDNQIGYISSLPQLFALVALIPGAILTGRLHDRRRPVEVSLVLAGLFYGLAGLAPFFGYQRVWFLIGMVSMANAPMALYNATWQNYFSDVVPVSRRNNHYTLRTSMTFFAGIVVIQVTGIILGNARSDSQRILMYQVCYWLSFVISLLQLIVLRQGPRDLSEHKSAGWQDLLAAFREIAHNRKFLGFFGVSVLFHSGWYFAWPIFFIAQVKYMNANEAWLSYITVSSSLLQWLTVRYWGKYIERCGIRKAVIIGAAGLAINPFLTALAAYLPVPLQLPMLLIFNLINAFTFSAFQLSVLQCLLEVIPQRYKSLNLSIYTSTLLLANTIMPILGVQIYSAAGASLTAMTLTMTAATGIRLFGAFLFWRRWRRLRDEPDNGIRG
ncbi:MAG: MFS transporter [Clostridiaceae bacterium]|nr:MFS transporter [Clostridiaceae bacterium]